MFADWKNDVAHVKKSFGGLGKKYPKMLQAYQALGAAAAQHVVKVVLAFTLKKPFVQVRQKMKLLRH